MSERKKGPSWFLYILSIGYFWLLARNFEPLKTINEMYSAPWYLVIFGLLIGVAIGITIGFRRGKDVMNEIRA